MQLGFDDDDIDSDADSDATAAEQKVSRSEELRTLEGQLGQLQALIASPGWQVIAEALSKQIHERQQIVLQPADGQDGLVKKEYLAGEVQGLRTAMWLASSMIEGLGAEIHLLRRAVQQENEQEEESHGSG